MSTPPAPQQQGNQLGLIALILAGVGFLLAVIPATAGFAWLLTLPALVVGIIGVTRKGKKKGTAIAAIILSTIAWVIAVIVAAATFFSGVSTAVDEAESGSEIATEEAPVAAEEETPVEEEAPVEEEVVAEEPAADLGEPSNPYPQPYTAEGFFGGENYTLSGRIVDANANALVAGYNMFNTEAPAGYKYVVAELTMTGINPDGVEPSLAQFDLSLATAEGNRYDSEYIIFGEGMTAMSDGPTLYPGSAFTGYTAYIVPEQASSFLLYDNGNYITF